VRRTHLLAVLALTTASICVASPALAAANGSREVQQPRHAASATPNANHDNRDNEHGDNGHGDNGHGDNGHGDDGHGDHHGRQRVQVHVNAVTCVGDTLGGLVTGTGRAGTVLTARLIGLGHVRHHGEKQAEHGNDHGSQQVGASVTLVLPLPAGGAPVHFDVAGSSARDYEIVVTDASRDRVATSRAVPASSCAPGHEVPEAPIALLAPLTMVGTVALVGARRLRTTRATV
jgi:hypothetical protein